jgi:hypothetical protein
MENLMKNPTCDFGDGLCQFQASIFYVITTDTSLKFRSYCRVHSELTRENVFPNQKGELWRRATKEYWLNLLKTNEIVNC